MTSISIISVNYKSTPLINALERQLYRMGVEFVVVDNSGDFVPVLPKTKIVKAGANLGFGRACNLGVRHSKGDTVLFLNPDTEFDKESFADLLAFSARQEAPAVWGPFIRDGKGEVAVLQSPGRARLTFRRRALTPDELERESIDVVFVSGACLAVQRSLFLRVGGFSEDIFLYGEDLDFCIRAHAAGARVFLTGEFEIGHKGGGSSTRTDRIKRLFRSTKGHYAFFRRRDHAPVRAVINALHLASGLRV